MPAAMRRAAQTTFRSLKIRNYRLYFFGQIVSFSGNWMQMIAMMWLVLQITGSGVALGTTTALQFAPTLVLGAWGGVIVDRLDKRRLLIMTQTLAAIPPVMLGVLTITNVVELWMVYALALMAGMVKIVDTPARQSFVVELVGPDHVSNAVGLNSTVMTSARVVGPAVAGVLITTVGIAPSFFINGVSFLAMILALAAMDASKLHREPPLAKGKGQLREGLRYTWSTPELRWPLAMMAVVGTLAYNFQVVLPMFARFTFDAGPGTYGLLSAMIGVGAATGALFTASRARPTSAMLIIAAFSFGVFMLLAAFAPSLPLAMAALVFMGASSIAYLSTTNSTLQLTAAPAMRGRVMALYSVVFLGSTPVGGPIVGWIAEVLGARAALAVGGASALVAGLIGLWKLGPRHVPQQDADPGERMPSGEQAPDAATPSSEQPTEAATISGEQPTEAATMSGEQPAEAATPSSEQPAESTTPPAGGANGQPVRPLASDEPSARTSMQDEEPRTGGRM